MTPHNKSLSLSKFFRTSRSSSRDRARRILSVRSRALTRVPDARTVMEYGVVRPLCKNKPECDAERVWCAFGSSKKGISEISSVEGGITEVVAFRDL